MGLMAAAYVSSFRLPYGAAKTQIQMGMIRVLIPSLIPLATHRSGQKIDFGAHLGGAICGAIMGLVLLRTWPRSRPVPRFTAAAVAISIAGAVALGFGLSQLKQDHRMFALADLLIPEAEFPASDDDARARAADLVARYPRDPRARLFRASALANDRDLAGAEQQLEAALAETEIMTTLFKGRTLEIRVRTFLAAVLLDDRKPAEAREAARSVCHAGPDGQVPDTLQKLGVCEAANPP